MVDRKQLLIVLLVVMGGMITASSSFAQDDDLMQDDSAQVQEGEMEGGVNFFIDLAQNQKIEGIAVDIQKLRSRPVLVMRRYRWTRSTAFA